MYSFEHILRFQNELLLILKKSEHWHRVQIAISNEELADKSVVKADVEQAPSVILPSEWEAGGEVEVSFLCARLQSVVTLAGHEKQASAAARGG